MTKKDYNLIAGAIRSVWERSAGIEQNTLSEVVKELSCDLARDNPRFDANKFQVACID